MKELFKDFMYQIGMYARVQDLLAERGITVDYYLKAQFPKRYVDGLGTWQNLEEGHEFWKNIEKRWFDMMSNKVNSANKHPKLKSIW